MKTPMKTVFDFSRHFFIYFMLKSWLFTRMQMWAREKKTFHARWWTFSWDDTRGKIRYRYIFLHEKGRAALIPSVWQTELWGNKKSINEKNSSNFSPSTSCLNGSKAANRNSDHVPRINHLLSSAIIYSRISYSLSDVYYNGYLWTFFARHPSPRPTFQLISSETAGTFFILPEGRRKKL